MEGQTTLETQNNNKLCWAETQGIKNPNVERTGTERCNKYHHKTNEQFLEN
jgi:hypothetical protein